MLKATTKHLFRLTLLITLLLALSIGGIYAWLATGTRTVPVFISQQVESFVTNLSPHYDVTIGATILKWQGWKNAMSITVSNTQVKERASQRVVADIPEILVNLDLLRLLRGHIIPHRLTLPNPTFYLPAVQPDTPVDFWNRYPPALQQLTDALKPSGIGKHFRRPFVLRIEQLTLRREGVPTPLWQLPAAEVRLLREPQATKGEIALLWGEAGPTVQAHLTIPKTGATTLALEFMQLSPSQFSTFFPAAPTLPQSTLALTGKGVLTITATGDIQQGHLTLSEAAGTLTYPPLFPKTLTLLNGQANITIGEKAQTITLENARLDFGKPVLSGSGTFTRDAASGYWGTNAKATVEALPIADLGNYWPIPAIPPVRDWLVTHITGGTVPKATGTFVIKPEYLIEKSLPPEAIAAEVQVEGAYLSYHPNFPAVDAIDGTVRFTGRAMNATINKARSKEAVLSKTATVVIPYFSADENVLEIKGEARSPIGGLLDYASPHEKPSAMLLYLHKFLGGKAVTNFDISLPLIANLTLEHMHLNIRAHATDVVLPNLADRFSLAGATVQAQFDGKNFTLAGDGKINNQPSQITLSKAISPVVGGLNYQVRTTIASDELPEFGITKPDILTGDLGVLLEVAQQESQYHIKTTVDLLQAQLSIPMIGWEKEKGKPSTLVIDSVASDAIFSNTPTFAFAADGVSARGTMLFAEKATTPGKLLINNMHFGKTNATAELRFLPTGKHLILEGDTIDLSDAEFTKITEASSKPGTEQFILDGNIQYVLFKNGEGLHNVSVRVKCEPTYCQEASLNGTTSSQKPLAFSLRQTVQDGLMSVQTGDAGALVRMLDISEHIYSGTLGIEGKVTREHDKLKDIKGQMTMRDFTAVKTPLLAKLLTLGSFSGILDRLNGKGIGFKKGNATFTYTPGTLYLEKSQASGPAIGLTAEGNIDIRKEQLDLTGTIVPAYTVNAFFGKIPVFGQILTGGSGQGVIAAKYRMSGTYKDAQVSLNPLSILTPGFLRGLFDIIDAPAQSAPTAPTPDSEADNPPISH